MPIVCAETTTPNSQQDLSNYGPPASGNAAYIGEKMFVSGSTIKSDPRQVEFDDGRHPRGRLGFILMSTDMAMESDLFRMAPEGVAINITRLKSENHTTSETLARHIDTMADAASVLQPDAPPDVICYGCTSGSVVIGEEAVMAEISKGAPKSKPMTLVTGVVDGLREMGAKKLVVCTPYLDDVNTPEAEFLLKKGFEVLDIQGLNISDGAEMGRVTPRYLKKFALSVDQPEADAIFISCGGIRSLEVIEEVEQAAGKPVITSNQAMMWSCMRRAGINDELEGFGQLFKRRGNFQN